MENFDPYSAAERAALLLRNLRKDRGISQRQLADACGLKPSVVCRAEKGHDARLSTWARLFAGLGYDAGFKTAELGDEGDELFTEEAERRSERRLEGLCAGKRRFW